MASVNDLRKRFQAARVEHEPKEPTKVATTHELSLDEVQALREKFGPLDIVQLVVMKQLLEDQESVRKGCPICGSIKPILQGSDMRSCADCGFIVTAPNFPELVVLERLERRCCPRDGRALYPDGASVARCPDLACGFWCGIPEFLEPFIDRSHPSDFTRRAGLPFFVAIRKMADEFNGCVRWVMNRGGLVGPYT